MGEFTELKTPRNHNALHVFTLPWKSVGFQPAFPASDCRNIEEFAVARFCPHVKINAMRSTESRHPELGEAQLELIRRSVPGAMSYFGLLLVVGVFTPYRSDYPLVFNTTIAILLAVGVARIALARWLVGLEAEIPNGWRKTFYGGVLTSAILWGSFSALTLSFYGEQWTGMIVLLMTAGIAAGGLTALAPDIVLARLYLAAMLMPSVVVTVATGGAEGYSVAMTISIFVTFLLFESKHQNSNFWQAVEDRASLRAKATELEEAMKLADEATLAKSNFLAKMSHEIRTPMNAVIGMTELLLDSELDQQKERFVRTIKDSSESLLEIVNDILDLSKIEAGKLELDVMDFDLRDSVHDVLRVLSLRAHTKGLELSCRVRPDVPYALSGDGGRLRQILINLVGNAIKFTPAGSVLVQIELDKNQEDNVALHFSVADTGIGVAAEQRGRIFEPFAQADSSTTRQYGGTGLGLSISKALVEMMQGKIWCESKPGQGSTFHFTAQFVARKVMPGTSPFAGMSGLADLHVLIVEDAPETAGILAEMFQSWRMRSTIVSTNNVAIDVLNRSRKDGTRFDFILVDAQMSGESGFTLAEYIVKHPELPPAVMMLTSVAQADSVERCRKMGLNVYIIKPVSESDLFDAIMSLRASRSGAKPIVQAAPQVEHKAGRLHILVAEDNLVNQEVAQQLLQKRGHAVTIAPNGRVAVDLVTGSSEFDLILMDIQMPEMDGFQATAAIRELERKGAPHIPIVAMTAHAMKGDRERCLANGMDGYISKPVQSKILYETIEAIAIPRVPQRLPQDSPTPVVSAPAKVTPIAGGTVNIDEIMDRLGGNVGLLQSIVGLFEEDYPIQMNRIREAIKAHDAAALSTAAHTLKGSLLVLAANRASAVALELEQMGRDALLEGAAQSFSLLESEVSAVSAELQKIVRERVSIAS